ncbi:MAG: hypothetical protein WA968_01890, partial [Castellaniella sp.]
RLVQARGLKLCQLARMRHDFVSRLVQARGLKHGVTQPLARLLWSRLVQARGLKLLISLHITLLRGRASVSGW